MREDLFARLKFGLPVFGGVHREENDDNSRPTSFKSILFFFFFTSFSCRAQQRSAYIRALVVRVVAPFA